MNTPEPEPEPEPEITLEPEIEIIPEPEPEPEITPELEIEITPKLDTDPEPEPEPLYTEPTPPLEPLYTKTKTPSTKYDDLLAYPEGIYNWIYNVCFVHIIYIVLAFYYELYLCGFIGIALFTTSLNYWKFPLINCERRNIDIVVAVVAISYHYYLSIIKNNFSATLLMSIGLLMYPLNYYLCNNNYIKESAICHCLLHIFNSLGACYIYINYYE